MQNHQDNQNFESAAVRHSVFGDRASKAEKLRAAFVLRWNEVRPFLRPELRHCLNLVVNRKHIIVADPDAPCALSEGAFSSKARATVFFTDSAEGPSIRVIGDETIFHSIVAEILDTEPTQNWLSVRGKGK